VPIWLAADEERVGLLADARRVLRIIEIAAKAPATER